MVNSIHNEVTTENGIDVHALDRLFDLTSRLAGLMERGMAERGLTDACARVIARPEA